MGAGGCRCELGRDYWRHETTTWTYPTEGEGLMSVREGGVMGGGAAARASVVLSRFKMGMFNISSFG